MDILFLNEKIGVNLDQVFRWEFDAKAEVLRIYAATGQMATATGDDSRRAYARLVQMDARRFHNDARMADVERELNTLTEITRGLMAEAFQGADHAAEDLLDGLVNGQEAGDAR